MVFRGRVPYQGRGSKAAGGAGGGCRHPAGAAQAGGRLSRSCRPGGSGPGPAAATAATETNATENRDRGRNGVSTRKLKLRSILPLRRISPPCPPRRGGIFVAASSGRFGPRLPERSPGRHAGASVSLRSCDAGSKRHAVGAQHRTPVRGDCRRPVPGGDGAARARGIACGSDRPVSGLAWRYDRTPALVRRAGVLSACGSLSGSWRSALPTRCATAAGN